MLAELLDLQADPLCDEGRAMYVAAALYAAMPLPGRDDHPDEALLGHVAAMREDYGHPGDPGVAEMRRDRC